MRTLMQAREMIIERENFSVVNSQSFPHCITALNRRVENRNFGFISRIKLVLHPNQDVFILRIELLLHAKLLGNDYKENHKMVLPLHRFSANDPANFFLPF